MSRHSITSQAQTLCLCRFPPSAQVPSAAKQSTGPSAVTLQQLLSSTAMPFSRRALDLPEPATKRNAADNADSAETSSALSALSGGRIAMKQKQLITIHVPSGSSRFPVDKSAESMQTPCRQNVDPVGSPSAQRPPAHTRKAASPQAIEPFLCIGIYRYPALLANSDFPAPSGFDRDIMAGRPQA